MDSMHQFLQLVAFASPLVTLAAMNVALLLAGEEDTLLLPSMRAYPGLDLEPEEVPAAQLAQPAQTPPEDLRLAA